MYTAGESRRSFDLSNKVAVVTGATGILGRWFSAALADHGATVALVDRDQTACDSLANELRAEFSVEARGYGCDLALTAKLSELADHIENDLGPVDILHNNAASKGTSLDRFFDPIEDFDPMVWREIMAVNLDSAFFVAREFGSRMARRFEGSIIQTASIYGVVAPDQRIYEGSSYNGRPISSPAVYSASKAGIVGLTKYLACYWGEQGVRVNTLTPGGVSSGQNDEFVQKYSARIPLARMAQPSDITGALVYLASPASRYVTGQNIIVDGGLTSW